MCFRPASLVLNKTCPECGEVSDATVPECPKCGHDLVSVEPDMPDPNAPGVPGAEVFDPSDIGKPPTAPKAPGAPAAPKAPVRRSSQRASSCLRCRREGCFVDASAALAWTAGSEWKISEKE